MDGVTPRAKLHDQKRRRLQIGVGKKANQQVPQQVIVVPPKDEQKVADITPKKVDEEVKPEVTIDVVETIEKVEKQLQVDVVVPKEKEVAPVDVEDNP